MTLDEIFASDQAKPGDTIRIDYRILSTNQAEIDKAVHAIKERVATDGRVDYQGSQIQTVRDAGRDIQVLSIYVTVRKTRREDREPIEYVELDSISLYIWATVEAFRQVLSERKAQIVSVGQSIQNVFKTGKDILEWVPLLAIGGLVVYFSWIRE